MDEHDQDMNEVTGEVTTETPDADIEDIEDVEDIEGIDGTESPVEEEISATYVDETEEAPFEIPREPGEYRDYISDHDIDSFTNPETGEVVIPGVTTDEGQSITVIAPAPIPKETESKEEVIDEAMFADIDQSLAAQIGGGIKSADPQYESIGDDTYSGIDEIDSDEYDEYDRYDEYEDHEYPAPRKKKSRVLMAVAIFFVVLVLGIAACLFYFFGTDAGQKQLAAFLAGYAAGNVTIYDPTPTPTIMATDTPVPTPTAEADDATTVPTPTTTADETPTPTGTAIIIEPTDIPSPTPEIQGRKEENIVNILLIGEEPAAEGATRGETDLIMIFSININDGTLGLVSLSRDLYTNIAGNNDRLSTCYAAGDVRLLYDTISTNYNLHLDGYVHVDYTGFAQIIDLLGGIDIQLTNEEASYLSTTNYISQRVNRKGLAAGINHLNGDQVLGYCRISAVPTFSAYTVDGKALYESGDFGRTLRQRKVLSALFNVYKTQSFIQLAAVADACLPLLKTDITEIELSGYIQSLMNIGFTDINKLRLPSDGTYSVKAVNGASVYLANEEVLTQTLHNFIFGR